jgi:hypothetical protein
MVRILPEFTHFLTCSSVPKTTFLLLCNSVHKNVCHRRFVFHKVQVSSNLHGSYLPSTRKFMYTDDMF